MRLITVKQGRDFERMASLLGDYCGVREHELFKTRITTGSLSGHMTQ